MTEKKINRHTEDRILAREVAFEIPESELKSVAGGYCSGHTNEVQTPETTGYHQDLDYHMN